MYYERVEIQDNYSEFPNRSIRGSNMSESVEKKLFAVYLGGRADGCNIEMHDIVFFP